MDPKALYHLTYGLYLLTAREDGRDNGCIINTAIQVANNPTRIAAAVIRNNHTRDMICRTGTFNVSAITTEADFGLFQRFGMQSGRDADKFAGFPQVARSENGLYYLTGAANMYLSARVTEQLELGSHTLFIAEVTHGEVLSEARPCTYAYYQSDIKARSAPRPGKPGWVCTVCGYVYQGEEVPEDFLCPLCSHGKEDFVRADEAPAAPETAPAAAPGGARTFVCSVCGYVHTGDAPPEVCPLCRVGPEKFVEQTAAAEG